MKISLFGLGYVGSVTAACFAAKGHDVICVDSDAHKVDLLNQGKAPVQEKGLAELTQRMFFEGKLHATMDAAAAVTSSDLTFICVGTPSLEDGSIDLTQLENTCRIIGKALASKPPAHMVVVRSTILPGTMRQSVIPILQQTSGRKAGQDFYVCHNPEFMREGSAIADFNQPPKIVVGTMSDLGLLELRKLYHAINATFLACTLEEAEMVKYADNSWHANKIIFANEMGNLCKALDIDSHIVMDMFCQDTKLNLSPYYLRPGFAFGGSCLPKDLRALLHRADSLNVPAPLLHSLLPSNEAQIDRLVRLIEASGKHRIGFLGAAFKAGTDDTRESPILEAILRLKDHFSVSVYDPLIPQLAGNMDTVLAHSDVIVISQHIQAFAALAGRLTTDQLVIDLVRIPEIEASHRNYYGFCW